MMRQKHDDKFDFFWISMKGAKISSSDAANFEEKLLSKPNDLVARASLIGFYSFSGKKVTKRGERSRNQHILWVLEHAPKCGLGRTPALKINHEKYPEDYQEAKNLLLRQCKKFRNNSSVLTDLASALSYEDLEIAVQIVRQAYLQSGAKNKAKVAFTLARMLHALGQQESNQKYLREATTFMEESLTSPPSSSEFDFRYLLAQFFFDSKQFSKAQKISMKMLADVPNNNQCVHTAHNILGLIRLKYGDIDGAKHHLLLAGKVGDSPRLCSYGPLMDLAQRLLELEERNSVSQYLTDCGAFWKMGRKKLAKWEKDISDGGKPKLEGDHF